MSEINNIPKHWEVKKLGEVCDIIMGQSPPSKTYNLNKIGLPFFQGKAEFTEINPVANKWCDTPNKIALPNDVLLSVRAPVGTTNIANQKCCIGRGLAAIRYDNYKYIFYFLRSIQQQLDKKGTGTTFRAISGETIRNTEIPIPPIPEQLAIVSKIEELLSDLENGKQQLLTAQQQLKVYRQSLLKWAFEGRLTNENVKEGELPEGWKWVKFDDVCAKIGDIDHKMPKEDLSGFPYISTKDFTDDFKISFDKAKHISKEDYINLSRKIKPERGDIIFPRYGTIGKNILIDFDKEFLVSYSCAVIKPNHDLVLSKYVYLYSLSPTITEEIRKYTVETTQANIGIASIKSFIFPLPTLSEQSLIIDELESKLTVCDKIEETISQSLEQAETLRQSILKRAFEGRLVKLYKDYK
jgi:type I restriction enzyme S subunit